MILTDPKASSEFLKYAQGLEAIPNDTQGPYKLIKDHSGSQRIQKAPGGC